MAEKQPFIGQKVWCENRKHPEIKDWMDCYGKISGIIREDDDDQFSDVESLLVSFDKGHELISIDHFSIWNDRNECWELYGYPEN